MKAVTFGYLEAVVQAGKAMENSVKLDFCMSEKDIKVSKARSGARSLGNASPAPTYMYTVQDSLYAPPTPVAYGIASLGGQIYRDRSWGLG